MLHHFYSNIEHYLFALILLGRIGDIGSTYLATPQLKLETNPIMRKLKWPFAVATLLISMVAYYHTGLAVMVLIPTYFVCSANISKLWAIRAVGEEKYFQFLLAIAAKSHKKTAMFLILVSNLFTIAVGSIILVIYPSMNSWGFHIGAGIALTGVAFAIYEVLFTNRLFQQAMKTPYEIQISPI